jgi:hypothetical protein
MRDGFGGAKENPGLRYRRRQRRPGDGRARGPVPAVKYEPANHDAKDGLPG